MAVPSRRVVVLRGHNVNPWELRSWERLGAGYDVAVLVPEGNLYDGRRRARAHAGHHRAAIASPAAGAASPALATQAWASATSA